MNLGIRMLEDAFDKALRAAFEHRILSFDENSAHLYGKIMSRRKALGRPLSIPDRQIAAIACANNYSVATRNTNDFSKSDESISTITFPFNKQCN